MFKEAFGGLRVFVTGHTGFKGSWLSAWLLKMGAEVCGYSLSVPTKPAAFEAMGLAERLLDLRGDVRNIKTLEKAVADFKPEIIFHLAAQPLVRQSYQNPVETFETNMLGVMNILEIARHAPGLKGIVVVTSDKCYRNEEWVWGYRETDRLGGTDPYSASKGCAELIAHSYFESFMSKGAAGATARAGNVIGGGDWASDRIVPDCVRAWHKKEPVILRNPAATRPWQHVLEPLSGYLCLGAYLLGENRERFRSQSYNFGPPADMVQTVAEVAGGLSRFWKDFNYLEQPETGDGKKECNLLKLCCDKALVDLDWKATLDFEETLRYTAEWYACYYLGQKNMWDFTMGQIAAYANAASQRDIGWALS